MQRQSLHVRLRKSLCISALLILLTTISFCLEGIGMAKGFALPGQQNSSATNGSKVWLVVKVDERRLELVGGYRYRMDGAGEVNFKDGGRVIELPEGLTILVNDEKVETERQVHEGESVHIINSKGETVWKLSLLRAE